MLFRGFANGIAYVRRFEKVESENEDLTPDQRQIEKDEVSTNRKAEKYEVFITVNEVALTLSYHACQNEKRT